MCGENVEDREKGIDEANFFMRDDGKNSRDDKSGSSELVSDSGCSQLFRVVMGI